MPSNEPATFHSVVKAREYADKIVGPYRPGLRTFIVPRGEGYAVLVETGPGLGGFATWPAGKTKRSRQTRN